LLESKKQKHNPLLKNHFEKQAYLEGYRKVAGVDEAGRGPLAGPLVVAACILPESLASWEIDDSKKLTLSKRRDLYEKITSHPEVVFSIVIIEPVEIDRVNILQATLQGMQKAVLELKTVPDFVLVDGNRSPTFSMPSKAVIQGDALSYSIGAASILAKVKRDEIMEQYHLLWPDYGFLQHKGYPTAEHQRVLLELGPSPIHRKSYAPVQRALELKNHAC